MIFQTNCACVPIHDVQNSVYLRYKKSFLLVNPGTVFLKLSLSNDNLESRKFLAVGTTIIRRVSRSLYVSILSFMQLKITEKFVTYLVLLIIIRQLDYLNTFIIWYTTLQAYMIQPKALTVSARNRDFYLQYIGINRDNISGINLCQFQSSSTCISHAYNQIILPQDL